MGFKIYELGINGVNEATRKRRKDCDYILWEFLISKFNKNSYLSQALNILLEWYHLKNRKERIIFLINAILLTVYQNEYLWLSDQKT